MSSYYNPVKAINIGQYAENITLDINSTTNNLVRHMPLWLTTNQRMNLDPALKYTGMCVFDYEDDTWYQWGLVNGVYAWKVKQFAHNFYAQSIQTRRWHFTLSASVSEVSYLEALGTFKAGAETILVALDGTWLTEGKNFVNDVNNSKITTTGLWYQGQEMTITILYSTNGDIDQDLTDLVNAIINLEDRVTAVENNTTTITARLW